MNNKQPAQSGHFLQRNWKKIAITGVIVSMILVFFAPTILVKTGVLSRLVNQNSGLNGKIDFRSASLGWFSKTRFDGLSITDANGELVAEIDQVLISKSLFGLISSGIDRATVTLTNSNLKLIRRQNGRLNLEELLAESEDKADKTPLTFSIELRQAKISSFLEEHLEGTCTLAESNIEFTPSEDSEAQKIVFDLNAATADDSAEGSVELAGFVCLQPSGSLSKIQTSLQASHSPLSFLNPLLNSDQVPALSISADGRASVDYASQGSNSLFDTSFEEFSIARSRPDKKMFNDKFDIPIKITGELSNGASKQDSKLTISSVYGNAEISGTIAAMDSITVESVLQQQFQLKGDFDFARFAADYPQWIRLREGTELIKGAVSFTAFSRVEGLRRRILVDLRSDGLVAKSGDRSINWQNPIGFSFAVADSSKSGESGLELEFVECKSDFLNIRGSGNLARGKVDFDGNLALLRSHLSEFFDLGQFQLAGLLKGDLHWSPVDQGLNSIPAVQFVGQGDVQAFKFGDGAENVWQEDHLAFDLKTSGKLETGNLTELQQLEFGISAGKPEMASPMNDRLRLVQRNPVQFNEDYQLIFDAELFGELRSWMDRAEPFLGLGIETGGQVDAKAVISVTPKTIRVRTKNCRFKPLIVHTENFILDEAVARTELDIVYRRTSGAITSDLLLLESSTVALGSKRFESKIVGTDRFTQIEIDANIHSEQLGKWFLPKEYRMNGIVTGQVKVTQSNAGLEVESLLKSSDFELVEMVKKPNSPKADVRNLIDKGEARLGSHLRFNEDYDTIEVSNLMASVLGSKIDLKGSVDLSEDSPIVNLAGTLFTDLDDVSGRLKGYIGDQVKLKGKTENEIRLVGPILKGQEIDSLRALFPQRLSGNARIKWDSGVIFGLPLEEGQLQTDLVKSEILLKPDNLKISQGKFLAAPRFNLNSEPYTISVAKGRVIDGATIGPEVFRTWMRYLTPLLADATEAKGDFSIALDEDLTLPLSNPAAGKLKGRMIVNSISVGPGPLGKSFIGITKQVLSLFGKGEKLNSLSGKSWLELPPQEIEVSLDGGRIAHQLVRFQIGEVAIFTSGSVDLDQNIDMVIAIPIEPDWFKDRPILRSVIGDAVRIPLKGKLSDPRFNLDLIGKLSKNMAGGALDNLIQQGAKGLLDSELLNEKLLKGTLLNGDQNKTDLGKFFEGKAKGLLKRQLFKGLDGLKGKNK